MFSWNVNCGKFQNLWPRDKFSFTRFLGTRDPLASPLEHQFPFRSPGNQARWQCRLVSAALGPPKAASLQSSLHSLVSSSHPPHPTPKVALKKAFFTWPPETHSKPSSGPELLLTRKDTSSLAPYQI